MTTWKQLLEDDPVDVLQRATEDYVPFSIRRKLEERGWFSLDTATYGLTAAGRAVLARARVPAP